MVSLPRNDAPPKWRCRGPSCVIAFGKSEVQYHPILGNSMNVWADLNTSSNYTGRRSLWALRPGKLEAHGLCVAQNNHQRFQIITRNVHRIAAIRLSKIGGLFLGKKHVTSKCGLAILSAFHGWACDTWWLISGVSNASRCHPVSHDIFTSIVSNSFQMQHKGL